MFGSIKLVKTLPILIEMPVLNQESELSCICVLGVSILYDFSIGFWNCSDSVVFFLIHFTF